MFLLLLIYDFLPPASALRRLQFFHYPVFEKLMYVMLRRLAYLSAYFHLQHISISDNPVSKNNGCYDCNTATISRKINERPSYVYMSWGGRAISTSGFKLRQRCLLSMQNLTLT